MNRWKAVVAALATMFTLSVGALTATSVMANQNNSSHPTAQRTSQHSSGGEDNKYGRGDHGKGDKGDKGDGNHGHHDDDDHHATGSRDNRHDR